MDYNDITPYDNDLEVGVKPKRYVNFDGVIIEKIKIPIFDEQKSGPSIPQVDGSTIPVLLSSNKGPVKSGECDPTGRASHEPGAKLDAGKIDYTLIPQDFLDGIARLCEDVEVREGLSLIPLQPLCWKAVLYSRGAKKYSPNGWKEVPSGKLRYIKAAYRHLIQHLKGEYLDRDSKVPHLASLSWNADAVLYYHENNLD